MSPETLTASAGVQAQEAEEAEKVGVGAYISLFFAMCFFSGVFYKMPDAYRWLGAFDFTTSVSYTHLAPRVHHPSPIGSPQN